MSYALNEQLQAAPLWEPELIKRYDRAGPRYTSYPTAADFKPQNAGSLLGLAEQRSDRSKPLSLYLHVPFCSSICYYCACNKIITRQHQRVRPFLDTLFQELSYYAEHFAKGRTVEQLHFGGGTPTFLNDAEIAEVMVFLRKNFNLSTSADADFSIEIDPRSVDIARLGTLRELGFNRLSFGVQDTNLVVQQAVNRIQPTALIDEQLNAARELGFRSINFDLIYGLPKQNLMLFGETLNTVIGLRPDRICVFNYAHLPDRFRPQRHINDSDLPSPAEKLDILGLSIERLLEAGYHYIGMDHFALPDDSLTSAQQDEMLHRNFQGYTTHGNCDLIACGPSAIGQLGDTYLQNAHDVDDWSEKVHRKGHAITRGIILSDDDIMRRALINQLICHFQLDFSTFSEQWKIHFHTEFAHELSLMKPFSDDGLINLTDDGLYILPRGRLLIRSLCMLFDIYRQPQTEQRFSRIV
ncbi:oxygen-independent coproporphyrinogen III oxidase [Pokkaliibacter sp. CJK22405]|uniref:oxygen-independent coproporphyrinogen III oxidase n=1 Tax=Pokkaliibacter sp. CJK22405 TaxID=3384615 RepID=UPI0039849E2F